MFLFHAPRQGKYEIPDWNRFNPSTDFGPRLYFSTDFDSAEAYAESRCETDDIARIIVPSSILSLSVVNGLSIINYGFEGTVAITENDYSWYTEQWSMSRADRIGWTRQVLTNRKGITRALRPDEFADIIIGPRADNDVNDYMREVDFYPEDLNDEEYMLAVFEELMPYVYSIQVALNQQAFDCLNNGKFSNEQWR